MANFEEFDRGTRARFGTREEITIQRRGGCSARRRGAPWAAPAAVTLLADKNERLIAFRSAAASHPNAHAVRKVKGASHLVSAKAFCLYAGVDLSVTCRYPLVMDDGIGIVDLKQPGRPVTSSRAGTGRQPA